MRHLPAEAREPEKPTEDRVEWHANGTRRTQGRLAGGRRDGLWTRWFDNGRVDEETSWRDGLRRGPATGWYPCGQLRFEAHYFDDRRNGPWAAWYPDGAPAWDAEFIDDRPHSEFTRWWPNGEVMVEGRFERGVPEGPWRALTPEGDLVWEGDWTDDLAAALPPEIATHVELGLVEVEVQPLDEPRLPVDGSDSAANLTSRRMASRSSGTTQSSSGRHSPRSTALRSAEPRRVA